jgi:hypothetical protein
VQVLPPLTAVCCVLHERCCVAALLLLLLLLLPPAASQGLPVLQLVDESSGSSSPVGMFVHSQLAWLLEGPDALLTGEGALPGQQLHGLHAAGQHRNFLAAL